KRTRRPSPSIAAANFAKRVSKALQRWEASLMAQEWRRRAFGATRFLRSASENGQWPWRSAGNEKGPLSPAALLFRVRLRGEISPPPPLRDPPPPQTRGRKGPETTPRPPAAADLRSRRQAGSWPALPGSRGPARWRCGA